MILWLSVKHTLQDQLCLEQPDGTGRPEYESEVVQFVPKRSGRIKWLNVWTKRTCRQWLRTWIATKPQRTLLKPTSKCQCRKPRGFSLEGSPMLERVYYHYGPLQMSPCPPRQQQLCWAKEDWGTIQLRATLAVTFFYPIVTGCVLATGWSNIKVANGSLARTTAAHLTFLSIGRQKEVGSESRKDLYS